MNIRVLIIIFICLFLSKTYYPQSILNSALNNQIIDVLGEINQDSVRNYIQTLQNFKTRFMKSPKQKDVAEWIKRKFISFGLNDVEIDSFYSQTERISWWSSLESSSTIQYNVIARLRGTIQPEKYYVMGAHHDSVVKEDVENSPGANDNASGVAAVLESARVIMKKGILPASSIIFVAFANEELAGYSEGGSEYFVDRAIETSMDIELMINVDMIAYSTKEPERSDIYITGSLGQGSFASNVINIYTKLNALDICDGDPDGFADGMAFAVAGYKIIFLTQTEVLGALRLAHTVNDIIENCNIQYCTEAVRAACGILLCHNQAFTVQNEENYTSKDFLLYQNYPNPFNPLTTIKFSIPAVIEPIKNTLPFVTLKVFDSLGRELETLVNEVKSPGVYQVQFNGSSLPSGIYFCKLTAGNKSETKKLILLK